MERGFRLTMTKESMHALGVPIPRREESPYLMGRGECPYPRRRGESLSDGERRMSLSQDERRVSLSQEGRRVSLSQEESVPIPRGEQIP